MKNIAIIAAIFLGACVSSQPKMKNYTVSGGEVIQLPVFESGALATETKEIRIDVAGFMVDGEKSALIYTFGFTQKNKVVPRKVVVEDVTNREAVVLVRDEKPSLTAEGYWFGSSDAKKPGDPSISWLAKAGDTEKVFKFTINTPDGRVLVLYQPSIWSSAAKTPLQKMLSK